MDFIYIDLIFLALFIIIVGAFLYIKRKYAFYGYAEKNTYDSENIIDLAQYKL